MPKDIITEAKIAAHLQTLRQTPQRIAACTNGLDEQHLKTPPMPKEWSPVEILAHLRGCAEVWSYSIYAMLTLDNPELAHIHPRDWAKKLGYAELSFAENFEAFEAGRKGLLRVLEGLPFAAWERSTRFMGRVNTFTIFGETERMAGHEAVHCDQLEAMLLSK
jgi:hypothetical protein